MGIVLKLFWGVGRFTELGGVMWLWMGIEVGV